jgi:hypothetical protein
MSLEHPLHGPLPLKRVERKKKKAKKNKKKKQKKSKKQPENDRFTWHPPFPLFFFEKNSFILVFFFLLFFFEQNIFSRARPSGRCRLPHRRRRPERD